MGSPDLIRLKIPERGSRMLVAECFRADSDPFLMNGVSLVNGQKEMAPDRIGLWCVSAAGSTSAAERSPGSTASTQEQLIGAA
jgi:hypothetical protein